MSTWVSTVENILKKNSLSQSQKIVFDKTGKTGTKISHIETIEAVTGWLGTHLTEYTEGSSEGASRRVVWVYDNGWLFVVGEGMYPLITHLEKELTNSSKLPIKVEPTEWVFEESTNGWEWWNHENNPEDILNIINLMSKKFGEPKLVLPLGYKINQVEDEDESEYLNYLDEGSEEYSISKTFYRFITFINSGNFAKISPWEVIVTEEDDYMPYYCDYNRFFRMTNELEEKGWLVIIDEHCAACASGTRKYFIEQNPHLKDAPEFLTWSQNSQGTWMPDGKIFSEQWLDDEKDIKKLIKIAAKHGLHIDESVTFDSF